MTLDYESRFKAIIAKNKIYGIEDQFFDLSREAGAPVPSWVEGQTLYEVFVRNFSSSGNFDGVRRQLQTIKDLGINILWFMPIYPIGQLKRKGSLGSPYAVRDFYAVNPEYGSKQDFKSLVEDIHALDMRVIIDMVPNHVAPDYTELTNKPELLRRNSRGEPDRLISDWTDIVDLDFTPQSTRTHTLDIMRYWISEFAIDGYRVDVAGMVPLEFWEWAIPQLRQLKPDLYLLAEWESPLLHQAGFNSTYDWTWHSLMLKVLKGRESAALLGEWLRLKAASYPQQARPLRFVENHDKPRAARVFADEALLPFLVLIFTADGIPLIYNGQEIGAKKDVSLFDKDTIDWTSPDENLYQKYKTLIVLRKDYVAMRSKRYCFPEHKQARDVLIYIKEGEPGLLVLINFRNKALPWPECQDIETRIGPQDIVFNSHQQLDQAMLQPYQAIIARM